MGTPESGKDPEEIAAELEQEALRRGAVGPRLPKAEQRVRNAAIIAGALAGRKPNELAQTFGIEATGVRRVLRAEQKAPTGLDDRPMELVEQLIRAYRRAIAEFEEMAEEYRDVSPMTSLRAKLAALATWEKLQALFVSIGKMPTNLELFRSEATLRGVVDALLDRLDQEADSGDDRMVRLREFLWNLVDAPGAGETLEGRELGPGQ